MGSKPWAPVHSMGVRIIRERTHTSWAVGWGASLRAVAGRESPPDPAGPGSARAVRGPDVPVISVGEVPGREWLRHWRDPSVL